MRIPSIFRPKLPDSFIFEVTTRCNIDCPHCYNVWKADACYPTANPGTAEILGTLGNMIRQMSPRLITLTGGEPLTRRDLPEIVDFIRSRDISINLITNGSLVTDSIAGQYRGKISLWELPLLSHRREIQDAIGGSADFFDHATHAIATLKAYGHTVIAVFVATSNNIAGFRQTAELALALGADGIMLNRFNPGGRGFSHLTELQASPEQLASLLQTADDFAAEFGIGISCSVPIPPCLVDTTRFRNLGFGYCAAGGPNAYYTLDPSGNVRPCNHSRTILGNINRSPLRKIIAGQTMRQFKAARPEFCHGCRMETICQGNCKAAAEVCYGDACSCEPFLRTYLDQARKL
ncbi:MAG: radical SAM protein [Verrucomicrobia bacterium]|nr:radical SAM protein [Verrucomicrobiota bacterium]